MKSTLDKKYDVVVLGATGYVGKRLVNELNKNIRQSGLRVMATVRSREKAQDLKNEFPHIDFEILDVLNREAVDMIVAKCKLVVSCIGPFDLYGENVVSSCARLGTHYLDITGEVLFAKRMIERYDEMAKQTGAIIVPFAGFDSVPSDLGVYLIGKEMRDKYHQSVEAIDLIYKVRGGLNGGTAATALDMGGKLSHKIVSNFNFLASELPYREYKQLYRPRFVKNLKRWVAPFFMEPINNKVVYRSLSLGDSKNFIFSPHFVYRESLAISGGVFFAGATALLHKTIHVLLKSEKIRNIFARMVPKSGQGPTESEMLNGFFGTTVVAQGSKGQVLIRKMKCQGDPGNVATVKILMACIATVMHKTTPYQGGLLTPATAFGNELLPELIKQGLTWQEA